MTLVSLILLSSLALSAVDALQCHTMANGNASNMPQTTATECFGQAFSCSKTVDFTTNLVSKGCSPYNCTTPGVVQQPGTAGIESCTNATNGFGGQVSGLTCCCYGNGCNSAVSQSVWTPLAVSVGLGFVARLFA